MSARESDAHRRSVAAPPPPPDSSYPDELRTVGGSIRRIVGCLMNISPDSGRLIRGHADVTYKLELEDDALVPFSDLFASLQYQNPGYVFQIGSEHHTLIIKCRPAARRWNLLAGLLLLAVGLAHYLSQ